MRSVNSPIKRRVIVGAAGLALAAGGGGIAVAASTGPSGPAKEKQERDAYINDAAQRLNVTPDKLEDALTGAYEDRLDQAVKDGRLTQAQADRAKKRVDADGVPVPGLGGRGPGGPGGGPGPLGRGFGGGPGPLGRGFRGGPGPGPGFGGDILRQGIDTAATYLGVSAADLRTQLKDGKSLADVAKAQNKDVAGLKTALTDFAKAQLAKAVTDKRLTQAQADKMSTDLATRVSDLVDGKMPAFKGRGKPPAPPAP